MQPLKVEKLSKDFGALKALQSVSLDIEEGKLRAIIGPNGAGKTTLFNLICGNLSPTAGRVYLFGQNVSSLSLHQRIRLGLGRTFQRTSIFPNLSLEENVLLAMEKKFLKFDCFGRINKDSFSKVKRLLQRFSLWEKRGLLAKELSYGEQRQIDLILGLALNPKLLLLDEPTAGLSPIEVNGITSMIHELAQDITVVLIEHDMDVVFDLADCITVLHHGQVLAEGRKEEIKADPKVREAYLGEETV